MFGAYRDALATAGARRFTLAGALGRLPMSMMAIGVVLLMDERLDSYAKAGIVAAGYALSNACFAPVQGRLADRIGQRIVLLTAAALFTVGTGSLLIFGTESVLVATLCAVIAGMGAPQTGNLVRRRWTHVLEDRSRLQTAFAIEAIIDESVFIIGPVLVTFLTLSVHQDLGLAVAIAVAILGAGSLAAQRSTEPPTTSGTSHPREALPWRILGPVVGVAVMLGVVFGSGELLIVAFAEREGLKHLAGIPIAVWSGSSLLAGLVVGTLPRTQHPVRWLRLTTLGMMIFGLPLPFVPNFVWLTCCVVFTGLMIAPILIGAVNITELAVPPHRLTEALTWTTTGLAVGVAPGTAISGWVADHFGAGPGFWVPVAAAGIGSLFAMILNPSASQLTRS